MQREEYITKMRQIALTEEKCRAAATKPNFSQRVYSDRLVYMFCCSDHPLYKALFLTEMTMPFLQQDRKLCNDFFHGTKYVRPLVKIMAVEDMLFSAMIWASYCVQLHQHKQGKPLTEQQIELIEGVFNTYIENCLCHVDYIRMVHNKSAGKIDGYYTAPS